MNINFIILGLLMFICFALLSWLVIKSCVKTMELREMSRKQIVDTLDNLTIALTTTIKLLNNLEELDEKSMDILKDSMNLIYERIKEIDHNQDVLKAKEDVTQEQIALICRSLQKTPKQSFIEGLLEFGNLYGGVGANESHIRSEKEDEDIHDSQ